MAVLVCEHESVPVMQLRWVAVPTYHVGLKPLCICACSAAAVVRFVHVMQLHWAWVRPCHVGLMSVL